LGGYLGLLLGGGAYIALGMLVSSYTSDQITAFFVSLFTGYFFFLIDKGLIFMGVMLAPYLEYICFDYHFQSIARGVIDSRNVIFFVSVIAACLMAASRSL